MAMNTCEETFSSLSAKVCRLLYSRTEGDWHLINSALDELNLLNYRVPIIPNTTKAVLLINQCCSFIPVDDPGLTKKCCHLITSLITLQRLILEGRTLMVALQWCLQVLEQRNDEITLNALISLEAILKSNTQQNLDLISSVVVTDGSLLRLIKKDQFTEIEKYALRCIELCTTVPESYKNLDLEKYRIHFEICGDLFIDCLCGNKEDSLTYLKTIIICLRGLENVILLHNAYLNTKLNIIFGIVKSYMLFALKDVEFVRPQNIFPSILSVPNLNTTVPPEKKGGKVNKQRKHKAPKRASQRLEELPSSSQYAPGYVPISNLYNFVPEKLSVANESVKTSDSDFSDSEKGNSARDHVMQGRVRQAALSLLLDIAKTLDKSVMFSYWTCFIPENSLSGKNNLLTNILRDPSTRGRMAALNVLSYFLSFAKPYLAQAEILNREVSFTSYSLTIGYTIKELHRCLCLALSENVIPVLIQVLKCFATLIQVTPYHRLTPGLISKISRNVKELVYFKDVTVQVCALIVFGCIIASEPIVPETKELFLKQNTQKIPKDTVIEEKKSGSQDEEISSEDEYEVKNQNDSHMPWLIEKCLLNLGFDTELDKIVENNITTPIKLESLQIISAMSRNYFDCLVYPHLRSIALILDHLLVDKLIDLKLHASKSLDFIGQSMTRFLSSQDICDSDIIREGLNFWQILLNGNLIFCLQSDNAEALRAVSCDCLGSIGSHIFERLPEDKKLLCITLLFSASRDENSVVKGAAVRALGLMVLYPTLREDEGFVVDTAHAVFEAMKDSNLGVRVKASWSMGNLSDTLVLNRNNESIEDIPVNLLMQLIELCIKCLHDNEKVKANVVRALGNFMQLISSNLLLEASYVNIVKEGIISLVHSCNTSPHMKVRWNACYALGNVLKNEVIYEIRETWEATVFNMLNKLVVGYKNFKVRINAALALSSPSNKTLYGQFYFNSWVALLNALENAQNMEDFSEYKHRDQLVEQICLSLGHLTRLLDREDLIPLGDHLCLHYELLKAQVHKVYDQLVPEKVQLLHSAGIHVKSFVDSASLSVEEQCYYNILKDIFIHEF